MSVTRHLEVIAPAYLEKFSCLGPTCPDTCCYGWQVPVEHESYLKLMRLQDDPLKPLVKQALVRGPGKPGSDNFGMLKLGATREQPCALLSESGLCQLHATHGETMLPDVCSSYPRASKAVDGVMDQFASPSCPEVARLLVEDVDALDLRTSQQPVRKYVEFRTTSMTPETMERLRSFFLGCMGATQLPVWQRLALQLLVAEAVEGCTGLDTSKDAQIGAVLDEWEGLLATGEALALLQDLPRHDLLHLKYWRRPVAFGRNCPSTAHATWNCLKKHCKAWGFGRTEGQRRRTHWYVSVLRVPPSLGRSTKPWGGYYLTIAIRNTTRLACRQERWCA